MSADGEGGKEDEVVEIVSTASKARSQNIRPFHLIRDGPAAAIVDRGPSAGGASKKLLREKEE